MKNSKMLWLLLALFFCQNLLAQNSSGEVKISLQSFGESKFELRVSDDGVGVSTEKPGTNFGSRLVNLLAMQLGGKLEQGIENGFWTRLRVG